jgi:hypothetical protein
MTDGLENAIWIEAAIRAALLEGPSGQVGVVAVSLQSKIES